jgi:hypothetical protein
MYTLRMTNTQWKPVTRFPFSACYEVSDDGRVRRLPGLAKDGRKVRGGEMAKVLIKGYHLVLLQAAGQKWMARVHHLVAMAFIGEAPGEVGVTGWTVNHKNFDKLDNRLENLEWMTAQDNHSHAVANGLKSRGERHYKSVLTADVVRRMRELHQSGMKATPIAKHLGLKTHLVSDVLNNRCWRHVI